MAASGPSLTADVAEHCVGVPIITVNDAYRIVRQSEVLYACDDKWWHHHSGAMDFAGERWSSHGSLSHNNKSAVAEAYGLRLVRGKDGEGFSFDQRWIHYGSNSGFQAINLAILFGADPIYLVGFDMRVVSGWRHFFGNHPSHMHSDTDYSKWMPQFRRAAIAAADRVKIINCTPDSALDCFPFMRLEDAVRRSRQDREPVSDAGRQRLAV